MKRNIFLQTTTYLVFLFGWTSLLAQEPVIVELNSPQVNEESYDNKAIEEVRILPGYDFLTGILHEEPYNFNNPNMKARIDFSIIGPEQSGDILSQSEFDANIDTSLPVGSINGVTSVSASGGALYTVPIVLPKGTAGMEPSISLNYNSQGGNGVLGLGWNLSATSSISLVPKNIYNDGETKGVQFSNANDVFSLDGNRLFVTNGGMYGGHNTEYGTESETYVKVISKNTSTVTPIEWFEVHTKDGKKLTYGLDESQFSVSPGKTLNWMLSKVEDQFGNYIEYIYINENNEQRLDEIKYTGNTDAGLVPYNRIQFHYIERQDKKTSYLNGYQINSNILLDFIDIRYEDDLYKKYQFDYGMMNSKTFLNSIVEIGAEGTELNPLKFKYNSKHIDINSITQGVAGFPNEGNNDNIYGDFNGDGKTDYVTFTNYELWGVKFNTSWCLKLNDGNGNFANVAGANLSHEDNEEIFVYQTILSDHRANMIADFNGDGMQDFAIVKLKRYGFNQPAHKIQQVSFFISNGAGFDETVYNSFPSDFNKVTDDLNDFIWFGDFDGNGAADMILNLKQFQGEMNFYTAFFSPSTNVSNSHLDYGVEPPYFHDFGTILDYNGDGKSDLIKIRNNIFAVYSMTDPNNTSSFTWNLIFAGVTPGGDTDGVPNTIEEPINNLQVGDFNGDGNTDVLIHDSWNQQAFIGFSNGLNNFDFQLVEVGYNDYIRAIDFNSDGKTDILGTIGNSNWTGCTETFPGSEDFNLFDDYDNFDLSLGQWVEPDHPYYTATIECEHTCGIIPFEWCSSNYTFRVGKKIFSPQTITLKYFNSKDYSIEDGYSFNYSSVEILSDQYPEEYVSNILSFPYTDCQLDIDETNYHEDSSNIPGFFYCVEDFMDNYENITIQNPAYKQFPIVGVTDINGDGILELKINGMSNLFCFSSDDNHNSLIKVKNGFGISTEIKYKPLTNPSIYTKGNSATFPVVDIQPALQVVTQIKAQTHTSYNVTRYRYEEGLTHNQGRGFLGFMKTYSSNFNLEAPEQAQLTITTNNYDDTFFIPYVEKKEVFRIDNPYEYNPTTDDLTSSFENNVIITDISNDRFKSEINYSVSKTYFEGIETSETTTNFIYDNYGNLLEKTTNLNNGYQTLSSTNTYTNFSDWWIPSKLQSTSASTTSLGNNPITSSKSYTYNDDGSLDSKTDHSGTSHEITTQYGYDGNSFGLANSTMITTAGEEPRITSVEYDSKGRYILKAINELNQESEMNYNPLWGVPKSNTDITGLTTTYEYDEWGNLIKTIEPNGKTTEKETSWSSPSVYTTTVASNAEPTATKTYNNYGYEISSTIENFTGTVLTISTYNHFGQVVTATEPHLEESTYGTTEIEYDDYGRPELSTFIFGGETITETTYTYEWVSETWDGGITFEGWKTSITGPDGTTVKYNDINDLVKKVEDETGSEIVYTHFSDGQIKQVIIDDNITNNFLYDQFGNKTELYDFNMGPTNYSYNNFGQLENQVDYLGNEFDMEYDILGRITSKTSIIDGEEESYTYEYITEINGLNSLKKVTAPNGNFTEYTYGDFNRVTSIIESIDGQESVTSFEYDSFGRVTRKVYPGSGFAIRNVYTAEGFLSAVLTDDYVTTIWAAGSQNAKGIYTEYDLGNDCNTVLAFDKLGLPKDIKTYNPSDELIQHLEMQWSELNPFNLDFRKDFVKNKQEDFLYSNNRLEKYTVSELTDNQDITYPEMVTDYLANGNINSKTDAGGDYVYQAQPHAVRSVPNSNLIINTAPQAMTYTNFNSLEFINQSGGALQLDLDYGADQQRRKQVMTVNDEIVNTNYYIGQYEKQEEFTDGTLTTTREVNYISSPSGICAMWVVENGLGSISYLHKDHLGSVVTITNNSGEVVHEQNFDPWGRYRNPDTWEYLNQGLSEDYTLGDDNIADWVDEIANAEWKWFRRGFTGHEMLPEFGIINMNGRCYDPVLGRMLQVDNFIQSPFNSQSYNRFTYAMNNPLRYTDPSGETWWDVVAGASIVGGILLMSTPLAPLGQALIGSGIAHFANSAAGVINQGQSWSQASKNAGFTFQGSFNTNWGYSNQQAAPNPMFAGGGTGGNVPNMTPNYAMADGNLSASLDNSFFISFDEKYSYNLSDKTLSFSGTKFIPRNGYTGVLFAYKIETHVKLRNNMTWDKGPTVLEVRIYVPIQLRGDTEKRYQSETTIVLTNQYTGETITKYPKYNKNTNEGSIDLPGFHGASSFILTESRSRYVLTTQTFINITGGSGNWPAGQTTPFIFYID